jgi:hypothetical protein
MGCQADLLQLTCDTLQELYPMGHLSFASLASSMIMVSAFSRSVEFLGVTGWATTNAGNPAAMRNGNREQIDLRTGSGLVE